MTCSNIRPFELSVKDKFELSDDDKTPEYPLSDDHPLSLHYRTKLLKMDVHLSAQYEDITPLSSPTSSTPPSQLTLTSFDVNTSSQEKPDALLVPVSQSDSLLLHLRKSVISATNIEDALQEKPTVEQHYAHCKLVDALDLAAKSKSTVTKPEKQNTSYVVQSLIDSFVCDISSMTSKKMDSHHKIDNMPLQWKWPKQMFKNPDLNSMTSTDSNNNSGGHVPDDNKIIHSPMAVENCIREFSVSPVSSHCESHTDNASEDFVEISSTSDVQTPKEKLQMSSYSSKVLEDKNVPPLLSPVLKISPKNETLQSSSPPTLTPIKIITSYPNQSTETPQKYLNNGLDQKHSPMADTSSSCGSSDPTTNTTDINCTTTDRYSLGSPEKLTLSIQSPNRDDKDKKPDLFLLTDQTTNASNRMNSVKESGKDKKNKKKTRSHQSHKNELKAIRQIIPREEASDHHLLETYRESHQSPSTMKFKFSDLSEEKVSPCVEPKDIDSNPPNTTKCEIVSSFPKKPSKDKPDVGVPACMTAAEKSCESPIFLSTDAKSVTSGTAYRCYPYTYPRDIDKIRFKTSGQGADVEAPLNARKIGSSDVNTRVAVTSSNSNSNMSYKLNSKISYAQTIHVRTPVNFVTPIPPITKMRSRTSFIKSLLKEPRSRPSPAHVVCETTPPPYTHPHNSLVVNQRPARPPGAAHPFSLVPIEKCRLVHVTNVPRPQCQSLPIRATVANTNTLNTPLQSKFIHEKARFSRTMQGVKRTIEGENQGNFANKHQLVGNDPRELSSANFVEDSVKLRNSRYNPESLQVQGVSSSPQIRRNAHVPETTQTLNAHTMADQYPHQSSKVSTGFCLQDGSVNFGNNGLTRNNHSAGQTVNRIVNSRKNLNNGNRRDMESERHVNCAPATSCESPSSSTSGISQSEPLDLSDKQNVNHEESPDSFSPKLFASGIDLPGIRLREQKFRSVTEHTFKTPKSINHKPARDSNEKTTFEENGLSSRNMVAKSDVSFTSQSEAIRQNNRSTLKSEKHEQDESSLSNDFVSGLELPGIGLREQEFRSVTEHTFKTQKSINHKPVMDGNEKTTFEENGLPRRNMVAKSDASFTSQSETLRQNNHSTLKSEKREQDESSLSNDFVSGLDLSGIRLREQEFRSVTEHTFKTQKSINHKPTMDSNRKTSFEETGLSRRNMVAKSDVSFTSQSEAIRQNNRSTLKSEKREQDESSLSNENNLVMAIDNEVESSPAQNVPTHRITKTLPVTDYFSKDPDEKSYSHLALAAITSKRKKSLKICNNNSENEDFLDFLRRDSSNSNKNRHTSRENVDLSVNGKLRNGELIDLTAEENEDIVSISSDEVIEDMNIVFEPGSELLESKNHLETKGEVPGHDTALIEYLNGDNEFVARRPTSVDSNGSVPRKSVDSGVEINTPSEIMTFPTVEIDMKSHLSPEAPSRENNDNNEITSDCSSPTLQESPALLDQSELNHIKEQSLAFNRSQKALMARKIQNIILKHSKDIPYSQHPLEGVFNLLPSERGILNPCKTEMLPNAGDSDTCHELPRSPSEPPHPLPFKMKRSLSMETDALIPIPPPTTKSDLRSNPAHNSHYNRKKGHQLHSHEEKETVLAQADASRQPASVDQQNTDSPSRYKTVWQTQFLTSTDNRLDRDLGRPRTANNNIMHCIELMRNAAGNISQVSQLHEMGDSRPSENVRLVERKPRRSIVNSNDRSQIPYEKCPESVSQTAHPDSRLDYPLLPPPVSGHLSPFIPPHQLPSPLMVAPYYAIPYPFCYPAFQGMCSSTEPVLHTPDAANEERAVNRPHRQCRRKRSRKPKAPLDGAVKRRRGRHTTRTIGKETYNENLPETDASEPHQKPPDPLEKEIISHYKRTVKSTRRNNYNDENNTQTSPTDTIILNPNHTTDLLRYDSSMDQRNIQELLGYESSSKAYLLQTRQEDGLTVLSMRSTEDFESRKATRKSTNNAINQGHHAVQNSCRIDLDLLNAEFSTGVPFGENVKDNSTLPQPTTRNDAHNTMGQNLATLALASEAHERISGPMHHQSLSDTDSSSHYANKEQSCEPSYTVSWSQHSLQHDDASGISTGGVKSQTQTQSLLLCPDEQKIQNDRPKTTMQGIVEKEKLVTEILASMMQNRNSDAQRYLSE